MLESDKNFIALLIVENFINPEFIQDREVTEENAYDILLEFIDKQKCLPVNMYQMALVEMAVKQDFCINKIRNFLHEIFVENIQPKYSLAFKH